MHTVLARLSLAALGSTGAILGLESFKKNHARHREGLDTTPSSDGELSTQAFVDKKGVHFVETALETHGNRSRRWLKDLLDCVIADPSPVVALEATRVLVAVYDGQDKAAAVELMDGAMTVEVEQMTTAIETSLSWPLGRRKAAGGL